MILNNLKNFEPNASQRKFEQGRQEALKKEQELLDRLKQLPDGEQKAKEISEPAEVPDDADHSFGFFGFLFTIR